MGSTPTATVNTDKNPANTPESSGRNKTSDQTGDTPRALKKKSTSKKKAATRKTARKSAAGKKTASKKKTTSKKTARKKTVGSKAVSKKAAGRKAATRKTSGKKVATKKAAGKKSASKKPASEKKTAARSRKRTGLAGVTISASTQALTEKAVDTSHDPHSLSWMAASAIDALNAVKAHQAEKATHFREARGAATAIYEAELEDIYANDPDAISPQEIAAEGEGRELTAGGNMEQAEAQMNADESLATATPAAEAQQAAAVGAGLSAAETAKPASEPEAEASLETGTDAVADEVMAPAVPEIFPLDAELAESAATDVEDTSTAASDAETSATTAGPDMPATDAGTVDTPTDMESDAAALQVTSEEESAMPDEPTGNMAAEKQEQAPVEEVRPEAPQGDMEDVSPVEKKEQTAKPAGTVRKTTPPPPPPPPPTPVSRQGMPVRMIVVAAVLGLAIILGYRYMGGEDEMTAPVVNLPGDDSPITDLSRPAISVVPVTVDTARQETGGAAAPIPSEDSTAAIVTAEETPVAADTVEQAEGLDAVTQGNAPVEAEAPAIVQEPPTDTAATTPDVPPGSSSPEPVVMEDASITPDVTTEVTPDAVAVDEAQPVMRATEAAPVTTAPSWPTAPVTPGVPAEATPDAAAANEARSVKQAAGAAPVPEPATTAPSRPVAPATRQPAYGTPGYGYYPRGWQQPSYRYPGWQSPPARQ